MLTSQEAEMLPCCGRELEGAGRHGLKLVASLRAWEGMPPTPEPSHFHPPPPLPPRRAESEVLQAREQPGQGRAVVLSYKDCTLGREEVKRPGRRSPTRRQQTAQHVASGVRLWSSKPAPGCVAFGELRDLSVCFDRMWVMRVFSLKSSCRVQM